MSEELKNFIKNTFEISDSEFSNDLDREDIPSWDSLKHMELVVGIEKKFDVNLEMEDIVNMSSVPAIYDVLKNKGIKLDG